MSEQQIQVPKELAPYVQNLQDRIKIAQTAQVDLINASASVLQACLMLLEKTKPDKPKIVFEKLAE